MVSTRLVVQIFRGRTKLAIGRTIEYTRTLSTFPTGATVGTMGDQPAAKWQLHRSNNPKGAKFMVLVARTFCASVAQLKPSLRTQNGRPRRISLARHSGYLRVVTATK